MFASIYICICMRIYVNLCSCICDEFSCDEIIFNSVFYQHEKELK